MKFKLAYFIITLFYYSYNLTAQSRCNVYADNLGKILCYYYDTLNNQLYVGGEFSGLFQDNNTINQTVTRFNVGKIDLFTKTFTSWSPQVSGGPVFCIQKVGNRIFLGGSFNKVNSDSSYSLVSVDETTGNTINTFTLGHNYSLRTNNNSDVDTVYSMDYDNGKLAIGGIITKFNGTQLNVPVIILNAPLNNSSYSINLINPIKNYAGAGGISNSTETTKIKFYKKNGNTCLLTAARTTFAFSSSNYRYLNSINCSTTNDYDLICSDQQMSDFTIRPDTIIILRKGSSSTGNVFNSVMSSSINLVNGYSYGINLNTAPNIFPTTFINYPFFGSPPNYCYNNQSKQATISLFEDRYFIGNTIQDASCNVNNYLQVYTKSGTSISLQTITDTILPNVINPYTPSWINNQCLFHSMEQHSDKIIYLKGLTNNGAPMVETVCLLPKNLVTPYELNNSTNFCRGETYSFIEPTKKYIYNYNWSYSGTGATILNNGNDTVSVIFAQNATSGNLIVTAANSCGVQSNTVIKPINFQPLPSISTPIIEKLNCYNNKQTTLQISSTTTPVSYIWNSPNSGTIISSVITASVAGNYSATVIDNITGCKNKSVTQVLFDTIKPIITNVSASYTLNCIPPSLTISPTSCPLPPCNDSLYWSVGNQNFSLPIIINSNTSLIIKNKNLINGCITNYTTTVIANNSPPTYTLISTLTPQTFGLPLFDPINCLNDSVFIHSIAATTCKIKWKKPTNDTAINPFYAKGGGIYQLLINDTITGCKNNSFFGQLNLDKTEPNLTILNNYNQLNCSYTTTTIQANSTTPGSIINWIAPSISYTANNPAIISSPANYYAIATNSINGCNKKDSITISYSNSLNINRTNDSTVCFGGSISLTTNVIGGTPPFNYLWNNNGGTSNTTLLNNITSNKKYIISITDNDNCVGVDTINIKVANQLTDSVVTFKKCDLLNPGGQIQVYVNGGIPPYLYSINNGINFQSANTFTNLNFGYYPLIIKDNLNCTKTVTANISQNSFSPKVDFLVNTSMMQTDTFVLVNISNPRPDSITWILPSNIKIVNNSNPFSPIIVCLDTGFYLVKSVNYFGNCKDSLIKLVHFVKYDTNATKTGLYKGIKTFSLFPNPNTGQFNVAIELYKKQNLVIKVFSANGTELLQTPVQYGNNLIVPINILNAISGNYFLRIIAEFDSKQKSFIIINN